MIGAFVKFPLPSTKNVRSYDVTGMLVVDAAGVETATAAVGDLEAEAGGAGVEGGDQEAGRVGGRKEAGAGKVAARGAGRRARRRR